MRHENEHYAYFTICSGFDPDEITKRVGINPTESWKQGELHPKTGRERKLSRWSLFSTLPKDQPLEAHVRGVLAQLDRNAGAFRDVSNEFAGVTQLVGYFWAEYPGLSFERDIVSGLARYGLSVDFDFYGLYSHRRGDTER